MKPRIAYRGACLEVSVELEEKDLIDALTKAATVEGRPKAGDAVVVQCWEMEEGGPALLLPPYLDVSDYGIEVKPLHVCTPGYRKPIDGVRDYQDRVCDLLYARGAGQAVMACGAGKTFTAMNAIRRLDLPTLVLVHTLDLADQWIDEIGRVLGTQAGFIGDGKKQPDHDGITVAVIQSLVRMGRDELAAFLGSFEFLVLDEGHHVGAETFRGVVSLSTAPYRLLLTATRERADGLTPILGLYFGDVLCDISQADLVQRGVLMRPEVEIVSTGYEDPKADDEQQKVRDARQALADAEKKVAEAKLEFEFHHTNDAGRALQAAHEKAGTARNKAHALERSPWQALALTAMSKDSWRNGLIVKRVQAHVLEGHSCLVLCSRVEQCSHLAHLLNSVGVDAEVMTSKVGRAKRRKILSAARSGACKVIIATSLADEGLDVPILSRLHLTGPSKNIAALTQRIGRVLRKHPSKVGEDARPHVVLYRDNVRFSREAFYTASRLVQKLGA